MIDDPAVDLLGDAIVERSVAGFQVVDRDASSRRRDRRQSAVGVAKNEHAIGLDLGHGLVRPLKDLGGLFSEPAGTYAQMTVGRPKAELFEEDLTQVRVVVLPGVHEDLLGERIETLDDQAQADDLGTRPEQRQNLQLSSHDTNDRGSVRGFSLGRAIHQVGDRRHVKRDVPRRVFARPGRVDRVLR